MLNHKGTILLETDRLILRRFVITDAEAMFKIWANDERVTEYLSWQPHANVEVTKELIDLWIDNYVKIDTYNWVIFSKEYHTIIGSIGVVSNKEATLACELGWCIGYNYWNKGYVTEAGHKVLDFLFDEVGYNRITAHHNKDNIRSGKVMTKIGMQYEGLLRQQDLNNKGELIDMMIYAILKEDRK